MTNEKHTCCVKICTNPGLENRWHRHYKECGKTAKFERDGEWFCGTHDPVAIEAKREARHAAWKESWNAKYARTVFVIACEKAVREIAFGCSDPVSVARNVLAKEFGDKP